MKKRVKRRALDTQILMLVLLEFGAVNITGATRWSNVPGTNDCLAAEKMPIFTCPAEKSRQPQLFSRGRST